jgi:hypothetical protein
MMADALKGHPLKWANEANEPCGEILHVTQVTADGMVAVDRYPGLFAPHCFRVVKEH